MPDRAPTSPTAPRQHWGQPKPIAVVCCGCGRVLLADGTIGPKILSGGVIDFKACAEFEGEAMAFATREDVDREIVKHGWQVIEGDHRCPNCLRESPRPYEIGYQGMYIDASILGRRT